jgi:hypothetical protein
MSASVVCQFEARFSSAGRPVYLIYEDGALAKIIRSSQPESLSVRQFRAGLRGLTDSGLEDLRLGVKGARLEDVECELERRAPLLEAAA